MSPQHHMIRRPHFNIPAQAYEVNEKKCKVSIPLRLIDCCNGCCFARSDDTSEIESKTIDIVVKCLTRDFISQREWSSNRSSQVNKLLHQLASQEEIWKQQWLTRFPSITTESSGTSWKQKYFLVPTTSKLFVSLKNLRMFECS